jgi:hypothetical protein
MAKIVPLNARSVMIIMQCSFIDSARSFPGVFRDLKRTSGKASKTLEKGRLRFPFHRHHQND